MMSYLHERLTYLSSRLRRSVLWRVAWWLSFPTRVVLRSLLIKQSLLVACSWHRAPIEQDHDSRGWRNRLGLSVSSLLFPRVGSCNLHLPSWLDWSTDVGTAISWPTAAPCYRRHADLRTLFKNFGPATFAGRHQWIENGEQIPTCPLYKARWSQ